MAFHDDLTPVGERFVALLRRRAETVIAARGPAWAAEQLGIAVSGVEALVWDRHWSANEAIHVAGRLGVLTDSDVEALAERDPSPV